MVLTLLCGLARCRKCQQPPDLKPTSVVTVTDTLVVTKTVEKVVWRDRIVAKVDTVYVGSEIVDVVASMDTTVVSDRTTVRTEVAFHTLPQTFDFRQHISSEVDTVYVFKNNFITNTVEVPRTNWWIVLGGTAAGLLGGVLLAK